MLHPLLRVNGEYNTKSPADKHTDSHEKLECKGSTRTFLGNYDTDRSVRSSKGDESKAVPGPSSLTFGVFPTHHGDETGTNHAENSTLAEGGHGRIGLCLFT